MSDSLRVTGQWAEHYRAYHDDRSELARDRRTYRAVVLQNPDRVDAQTIAVVLRGQVRFAPAARDVLRPAFESGVVEGGERLFALLRPHLTVTDVGQPIIAACEPKASAALGEACALLYIEANQRTITLEEPEELASEDEDGDDPPDEPPTGYGGDA